MNFLKLHHIIKFSFLLIWFFFLLRTTKYIEFDMKLNVNFFMDLISIGVLFFLIIYLCVCIYRKKKISKSLFLIIYPIVGFVSYFVNGFQNSFQESILVHHFVTLTSLFLYFTIIQTDEIFDYNFKELLLKTILFIMIILSLIAVFTFINSMFFNLDNNEITRHSTYTNFHLLNKEYSLKQNINGKMRFLFIFALLLLFLFRKFYPNKKSLAYLSFLSTMLLITVIYYSQSRLIILSSFIFSFFFIFSLSIINLKRKIILFLLLLIVPIQSASHFNSFNDRFNNFKILDNTVSEQQENSKILEKISKNSDVLPIKDLFIKVQKKKIEFNEIKLHTNKSLLSKIFEIKKLNLSNFFKENYSNYINPKLFDLMNKEELFSSTFNNLLITQRINDEFIFNNQIKTIIKSDEQNKIKKILEDINKPIGDYKKILLRSCSVNTNYIDSLLSGRLCGWEILIKINSVNLNKILFGNGFFADQYYLKLLEKLSSNSFVNIYFNAGIISLILYLVILVIFLIKYFKLENLSHKNMIFALSHYLILFIILRSIFEDTIAFVGIDFLILGICLVLTKHKNITKKFNF